ncbi:hypothetical protein [Polynucleobacter duraquae]|nr:hypothetical protein [Polynucleobacter duraquae]
MTAFKAMTSRRRLICATQFNSLMMYVGVSNAVSKANPVGTQ